MTRIEIPPAEHFLLSLTYLEFILAASCIIQLYVIYIFFRIAAWSKWLWPFKVLSAVFVTMLCVRIVRQLAFYGMIEAPTWVSITTHFYLIDSVGLAIAGYFLEKNFREQTSRLLDLATEKAKGLIYIAENKATSKIAEAENRATGIVIEAAAKAEKIVTKAAADTASHIKAVVQEAAKMAITTPIVESADKSKEAAAESHKAAQKSDAAAEKSLEAAEANREAVEKLKEDK